MNKYSDISPLIPPIEITVFQALTLLLEKYCDISNLDEDICAQIKSIYLTGVRTTRQRLLLDHLLEDPLLEHYHIKTTKHAINQDPVRRYFESHLCHNTLITSLDDLDAHLLQQHFESIFNRIEDDAKCMLLPIIDGRIPPAQPQFVEYWDGLNKLNRPDSYPLFQVNQKEKLRLIIKCMYAAVFVPEEMPSGFIPLDIYFRTNSIYHKSQRGRASRRDIDRLNDGHKTQIDQTVCPHTLGIMRSFMPIAIHDALFNSVPSTFPRAADTFTYTQHRSRIVDRIFSHKVTPFVGSISGTLLVKLRVMAQLLREHQFVYHHDEQQQLVLFMKTFIAYMVYHAGGHSLDEYFQVLELKIVQDEFKSLPGLSNLTLPYLFQENNTKAFDTAIQQTILYNKQILLKKTLHLELETRDKFERAMRASSSTLRDYVGTVSLSHADRDASYTVLASSILGGALLFAFIRLLDAAALSTHKQNSLSHHIKQLCFTLCLVTVAHAFSATLIKQESNRKHTLDAKTSLNHFFSTTTQTILDYSSCEVDDTLNLINNLT